jgi:hypothetical protein
MNENKTIDSRQKAMSSEEYIKERLDSQIGWYDRKSAINKKYFIIFQIITLVASASIPVFSIFSEGNSWARILIAILGSATAITTGIVSLYQFREHWIDTKRRTFMGPLCFVLMPFGRKSDASGKQIDFDAVYQDLIVPAILEAGLEPIRADEEMTGGIIHKPMFERLILCEYAVADLTTANANVFYELGVRHAVRPRSTVLLFSEGGSQLPFDVAPLRAMSYRLGPDGKPVHSD